ncbi:uncharacterized protein [Manis javanica]|uniref:uncharacterized protein isoform X1 n=1 Tax=Manis javanica TaxID=9974 RepID=UPI003C6D2B44
MQLAPETQGGPASWVEPVQELPETPVLELRPVSPASAPAEPEDILAEASAPRQGPELEPQEPSGRGHGATAIMVPGLAEPETCPDPMSPWDIPGVVSAPVPGPELEPHEPSSPGPVAPAGMTTGLAEPEADPEPISACVTITQDVPRTEERTILQFPADLVAEQLTLLCAEQYSRIEYGEFKACLESQPLMKGIELLAPNVQMVIRQFDAMVSLVISSCLGTVTMTAQDRAQVVQFWIQVAEECLALKNFAALRAILLALRSPPIGRLESTWGHVSWKSSRTYKKLKKRDEEANREWLLKVNVGQRSGRGGPRGKSSAVLWHSFGADSRCAGWEGEADGESRVPLAPEGLVCLPPWLHLTGGLASSEDPEDRLQLGLGLGRGRQQEWSLWLSNVGFSPGSPEPVTAPLWPRAPHVDMDGCRHTGVRASQVSRVQGAQNGLQLCGHPPTGM